MTTTTEATLLTVSQVAKLAHVTVRALHHYDQRGLLVPSERSAAGTGYTVTGTWSACNRSWCCGNWSSAWIRSDP